MPDTPDPPEEAATNSPKPKRRRKRKTPPAPAPAPTPLQDLILESAAEPKSVTVDGQTVQARDLREMIEAERFLASRKAAKRPGGGIRITSMSHSGAT